MIQRQLGHPYVSTTSVYLQGINTEEIISAIHARRAPLMQSAPGSNSEPLRKLRGRGGKLAARPPALSCFARKEQSDLQTRPHPGGRPR